MKNYSRLPFLQNNIEWDKFITIMTNCYKNNTN